MTEDRAPYRLNVTRQEGFYWVRKHGEWLVGRWRNDANASEGWALHGTIDVEYNDVHFEEIGPKIEPPA